MRRQAGITKGDLVEASFLSGKIIITPKQIIDRSKFSSAHSEYTPRQRKIIDRGIAKSEKEYKLGQAYGPFETHEEFIASLHSKAFKLKGKK